MYLRNAWYQACWAHDLNNNEGLGRRLLDEPVLICRDGDGEVFALADICPHRFAPLSRGTVANGAVTCGYHGLVFDRQGACIHNPHGSVPTGANVRSYPALERHLGIWIWMGDPLDADPGLMPDLSFIDRTPEQGRIFGFMPTKANYQLLTDNIMDLSHADYLHPTTLGGIMTDAEVDIERKGKDIVVRWWSENVDPPGAFKPQLPENARADVWTEVHWSAPAVMVLSTGAVPTGQARGDGPPNLTLHNITPETATSSHYFYCVTRHSLLTEEFSAFLKGVVEQAFHLEDKPMLEAQQDRIGARNFWDLHPAIITPDAAAVQSRRMLEKIIREEKTSAAVLP